jgi:uncharacterized membrane protein YphA (DoxX/SURF4 family)
MNLSTWLGPRLPRSTWTLATLRAAFGGHLLYHVVPLLLDAEARAGFVQYLGSKNVPLPGLSAALSLGTELLGAVLLVIGLAVRPASAALAFNFVVAFLIAHLHHPYSKSFESIQLFAVSVTLLGTGAGPLSIDALLARVAARKRTA